MKRFLYNLFTLGFILALIITLAMKSRSYTTFDEWRAWEADGPAHFSVTHFLALSNSGRVEVMVTREQVTDWFGRNVSVPQLPPYPAEQYETRSPTSSDWGCLGKYFPQARYQAGVAWGSESIGKPIDNSKRTTFNLSSMTPVRHNDRWVLAVHYKTLAWLFAMPLIWRVVAGKRKKRPPTIDLTTYAPK